MSNKYKKQRQFKINDEITSEQVRIVIPKTSTSFIVTKEEALNLAKEKGVDLIEISPQANPVICHLIEYSKFIYEQNKKIKKQKQKTPKLKEVKFTSTISDNDISYRVDRIKKFLSENHKVKVTMVYKGRTLSHPEIGRDKLNNILEQLEDYGTPQSNPTLENRYLSVFLNPNKK